MSAAWVKANGLQLFTLLVAVLLVVGQWQARQEFTTVDVSRNIARLERLEEFALQERARLDTIYLRRDLSDEQLRSISAKLDTISQRVAQIEVRTR